MTSKSTYIIWICLFGLALSQGFPGLVQNDGRIDFSESFPEATAAIDNVLSTVAISSGVGSNLNPASPTGALDFIPGGPSSSGSVDLGSVL